MWFAIILGLNLLAFQIGAARPVAGAGSGQELIDQVNGLRSANGLAPYKANAALMSAAQGHSNWMAENAATSHTGSGGSSPGDRAAVAGYTGSGVIENIASGANMSASQAVQIWQGDSLHLTTLLSPDKGEAGAGAAEADGVVYYTFLVGGKGSGRNGNSGNSETNAPAAQPTGVGALAGAGSPTAEIILAVKSATPGPDGAIIHVVEQGQTLWDIASAYQISLADLYAMNGLTDQSVIFPGEKLLIRPASQTLTPTFPVTVTVTLSTGAGAPGPGLSISETASVTTAPSPTSPPKTKTPSPKNRPPPTATASPETPEPTASAAGAAIDPLLLLIGGFALVGAALVIVGSVLKRGA